MHAYRRRNEEKTGAGGGRGEEPKGKEKTTRAAQSIGAGDIIEPSRELIKDDGALRRKIGKEGLAQRAARCSVHERERGREAEREGQRRSLRVTSYTAREAASKLIHRYIGN